MSFIYNIHARNVNDALPSGLRYLSSRGTREPSRVGEVVVANGPVVTIYQKPMERVLFSPVRDANPFFHLFEALWMLSGSDQLPWVVQFNKRFNTYSDDGGLTQPAAYGHRWRKYFGYDQLRGIVRELRARPDSRRAVLAMWDGGGDAAREGDLSRAAVGSADIPCNTHAYFRIVEGRLDMTVMCRSNDLLWGAHGANAVHFSVLQEFIATLVEVPMGVLYQFSNNYHYYTEIVADPMAMAMDAEAYNLYATERVEPMAMFQDPDAFIRELDEFIQWASPQMVLGSPTPMFNEPFLDGVAVPMRAAWEAHKKKDYGTAEALCGGIRADDWRIACRQWMERRGRNHRAKKNG